MNDINKLNYLDDSLVAVAQQKYQESKNKSITDSKIRMNGRTYSGKTTKIIAFQKKAMATMVGIGVAALTISAANKSDTMSDYQEATTQIVKEQLPELSDQINYQDYQELTEGGVISNLVQNEKIISQIEDEQKALKETGNYKFWNSNDLRDDAIYNVAVENTLNNIQEAEEYYEGGNGYGK